MKGGTGTVPLNAQFMIFLCKLPIIRSFGVCKRYTKMWFSNPHVHSDTR
jgi:hypothetical protein